jgi:hypothetical protein
VIRPSPFKSFTYHAFALEWITAAWMALEVVIAITASVKARSISLLAFGGGVAPRDIERTDTRDQIDAQLVVALSRDGDRRGNQPMGECLSGSCYSRPDCTVACRYNRNTFPPY